MPKRKKPEPTAQDYIDMVMTDVKCWDAGGEPRLAILAVVTPNGPLDLIVHEVMANEIIQALRDFLAEEAEPLQDRKIE